MEKKRKVRWTDEEDAILREYYPLKGEACFSLLPHRTAFSCLRRASILRLQKPARQGHGEKKTPNQSSVTTSDDKSIDDSVICNNVLAVPIEREWTEEEITKLKNLVPIMGRKAFEEFPERTARECENCAKLIGLMAGRSYSAWTEEEDGYLRREYPKRGKACFVNLYRHSLYACGNRVSFLGLRVPRAPKWSAEDKERLAKRYKMVGEECFSEFPGHTISSCKYQLRKAGLLQGPAWTDEEDTILLSRYPIEGEACFARLPKRSVSACQTRYSRLLQKQRGKDETRCRTIWSSEETEVLMALYPKLGSKCAKYLPGRTEAACVQRYSLLVKQKRAGEKPGQS